MSKKDFPYHMLDDIQFMEQKMEEEQRVVTSKKIKERQLERMIKEAERELDNEVITYRESVFLNKQLDVARDYYEHLTGEKYVEE